MATIKGFLEQIQKIAQEKGEDYCNVEVKLYYDSKIVYISYINKIGHVEGKMMRECIKNTREKAFLNQRKFQISKYNGKISIK